MKCPKCGYHSFDYLDSCKKCSTDLADHKSKFNLRSLIFPNVEAGPAPAPPVPEMAGTEEEALAQVQESALESGSDFGYDFMEDDAPQSPPEQAPPVAAAAFEAEEEAEDDAFSWDDNEELDLSEPADSAAEAAAEVVPETEAFMAEESSPLDDSFDWDEEEESEEVAAMEPQVEEEEAGADLGLDLSWDNDLPTLEEQDADSDFEAEDELPDWDFDEEPLPDDKKAKKPTAEESPQDPFELRESGFDQAPSISETGAPGEAAEPLAEAVPTRPDPEHKSAADPEEPESKSLAEPERPAETAPAFLAGSEGAAEPGIAIPAAPGASPDPEPEILSEPEYAAMARPTIETAGAVAHVPSEFPEGAPTLGRRLAASLIDLAILATTCGLFLIAGQATLFPESGQLFPSPDALLSLALPYFLILFAVFFGYFTLFHFLTGQTPGKMLTGLRVESQDEEPLSFSQAFLRSAGGLFSLLPCALGLLVILTDTNHRGWNDRLAGTRVTRAGANPELEELEELEELATGTQEEKQQAF